MSQFMVVQLSEVEKSVLNHCECIGTQIKKWKFLKYFHTLNNPEFFGY